MAKYTTSELIIYLDRIEGTRDNYGDANTMEHEPEMMEIKKRLLELDITKEGLIKFFGKGEVKFE